MRIHPCKNQKLANDLLNLNESLFFRRERRLLEDMLSDVPLKSTDGIQVDDEGINLKVATLVRNAMQSVSAGQRIPGQVRKSFKGR